MAAPVNSKTWSHDTNNAHNSGNRDTDQLAILLAVKNALVSAGWVVRSSSGFYDTGGGRVQVAGTTDYWDTVAALVWSTLGTGARSWIVLRNTALAGGAFDLLLECRATNGAYRGIAAYCTPAGYNTDGTTTAMPTAVTPATVVTLEAVGGISGYFAYNAVAKHWNVSVSSDKECTRVFVFTAGVCCAYWCFEKMKNVPAGMAASDNWYAACFLRIDAPSGDEPTIANLYSTANGKGVHLASSTVLAQYLTCEARDAMTMPAAITAGNPEDGGAWPIFPIGVMTATAPGTCYGARGEMQDMWWGVATIVTGSTHPAGGAKTHIKIGSLVMPWDGSVPGIS
jgi:hypothetical protein